MLTDKYLLIILNYTIYINILYGCLFFIFLEKMHRGEMWCNLYRNHGYGIVWTKKDDDKKSLKDDEKQKLIYIWIVNKNGHFLFERKREHFFIY